MKTKDTLCMCVVGASAIFKTLNNTVNRQVNYNEISVTLIQLENRQLRKVVILRFNAELCLLPHG